MAFKRLVLPACLLLTIAAVVHGDDLADRRQRIEQMSQAEKDELLSSQQRWERLSAAGREHCEEIHTALETRDDGHELREVMNRYYEWLKTLDPVKRAEIEKLPIEKRVATIKSELEEESRRRRFGMMRDALRGASEQDMPKIWAWLVDFMQKNQEPIEAYMETQFGEDSRLRHRLDEMPVERRLFWVWVKMNFEPQVDAPLPGPGDIKRLAADLTPQTRTMLEKLPIDGQRDLLRQLIFKAFHSQMLENASEEDVRKYFEKLPAERRSHLASLPKDAFERELHEEYSRHLMYNFFGRPSGGPRSPDRFKRGDGPPGFDDGPRGDGPPRGEGPGGPGRRGDWNGPGGRGPDGRDRKRGDENRPPLPINPPAEPKATAD
ncbi:hypothetical protein [Blastopirellula marina]|nr:hypothetical protein [Blastopirellula marina]